VVVDLTLPDGDGLGLLAKLGSELSGLPVMVLRAEQWSAGQAAGRAAGVAHYLAEPIQMRDLRNLWEALGESRGAGLVAEAETSHARILLAEDNPVNRQVALRMLTKRGHQVETAQNGVEAVALVEAGEFDVILMDVQMPEMDGFEATAAIRQILARRGMWIPIVALTANAIKGDRERCLAAGMDEYVSKPIDWEELFDKIRRLRLESGRLSRRIEGGVHEKAKSPD
jgi:two-component system, sensor histidine kinase and response regulator